MNAAAAPKRADVVVIGMGPGGEEVAKRLAEAGLDVVGVEAELLGGECPYWGCVPSKMIIRAAETIAEAHRVARLAGSAEVHPDFAPVAKRIREEATDDWDDTVAVQRFEKAGGTFVRGRATLSGRDRVEVDGQEFVVSRGVVLATGSAPVVPPIPGLADVPYWTNREAISAEAVPTSLAVLGGGAIGLELAQAFARFGSAITVIESAPTVLPSEEPEVSAAVADVLRAEGLELRLGARAVGVGRSGAEVSVELDDGSSVSAQRLLVAVGRRPRMHGLGLGHYGLDESTGAVATDERLRAAEGLWAVGDVTGVGVFTHLAVHQGRIAAADILGEPLTPADYTAVPRVTFTDPEIGTVGLTEAAARSAGHEVRTATAQTSESARGWIHGPGNAGLIKLVVDARTGVLIGGTAAGPRGGEVLGLLTLAVHTRLTVDVLRTMIYAYPTFHRGVEDALARL